MVPSCRPPWAVAPWGARALSLSGPGPVRSQRLAAQGHLCLWVVSIFIVLPIKLRNIKSTNSFYNHISKSITSKKCSEKMDAV